LDTNGAAWTPMVRLGRQDRGVPSGLDTNGAAWTPMERLGTEWTASGRLFDDCLWQSRGFKLTDLKV